MKPMAALSFSALAALVTSTVAHAQPAYGDYPEEINADPYGNTGDYDDTYRQTAQQVSDDSVADGYDDGYDPEAYQQFEEPLQRYGSWTDDERYGRIWIPSVVVVGSDFTPYYTGGHWVLSEYGWTWVSDWSWGWAPFHYGRWVVVADGGWGWVPGRVWGPAWVAWRSGGGYVGWAPLPPRGVRIAGYRVGAASPWRFTLAGNLGAPRPICVPHREAPAVFARTVVLANNRVVSHGAWRARINAGPVHVAHTTPVRLSVVFPHAAPRYTIAPRAPRPMPHAQPVAAPRPMPHGEEISRPMPGPHAQPAPRPMPPQQPHFQPAPGPHHQPGTAPHGPPLHQPARPHPWFRHQH
jgi:hypothetical protein